MNPIAEAVKDRLARAIPDPHVELDHENAWQLLVATILSARSTDVTINQVTPALFERWPRPEDLAAAPQEEVEEVVKRTGFFRNKARAIREAARKLVADFGGEVPRDLDALVTLPGVARKTANVVIGIAYGVPTGIAVDVHVARVSQRLGLTKHDDPEKIERDLCALWPRDAWIRTNHRLVLHGRYVCTAKKPDCPGCPLNEVCPSRQAPPVGPLEERAEREGRRVSSKGAER